MQENYETFNNNIKLMGKASSTGEETTPSIMRKKEEEEGSPLSSIF